MSHSPRSRNDSNDGPSAYRATSDLPSIGTTNEQVVEEVVVAKEIDYVANRSCSTNQSATVTRERITLTHPTG
jgi:hypothetical protein